MPADYTIIEGDELPIFEDSLTFSNGQIAQPESVEFVMRSLTAPEPLVLTGTSIVVQKSKGEVSFAPDVSDTERRAGNYMASWNAMIGGKPMAFPTEGWLWVQVQPNLTSEKMQLVSVGEVKDHLFIQANDRIRDDTLLMLIEATAPLIENLTGPILPKRYDEWYAGGTTKLVLRHKPSYGYGTSPIFFIQAASEYRGPIEYNLSIVPTPTQGSVYSVMGHPELGGLVRRTAGGGVYDFWNDSGHSEQNIHIVYYVGQETVPPNVKMATLETIRWWYQTSEAVGRGALTRADDELMGKPPAALPYHAVAMLNPTRKHPSFA